MKYFIIAGEASGDLHGANLINALREIDSQASFIGLGGDKMRITGCRILVDFREMAFMGIVAVLQNLKKIKRNFAIAKQALIQEQPDVIILIDYPSFNLKIAKFCKNKLPLTKVVYYIPPKIWAWKKWRVHSVAKYCDKILGIFPFEPAFYAQYGYTCHYVGNPTADYIRNVLHTPHATHHTPNPIIAILPGSRRNEIIRCLPTMLRATRIVAKDKYDIHVVAAPGIEEDFYKPYLQQETLVHDPYSTLKLAYAAVVNSGTATLETALIGCPQTAVYHVTGSKYLEKIFRPIIFSIPYFTLVNIIPQQEIIQELIASRFTEENIINELYKLLNNPIYRKRMINNYQKIWDILGNNSTAENAATHISLLFNH